MSAKVTFDIQRCKGCALCTKVCPKQIIIIDEETTNNKGYHPAKITNINSCIACASCGKICPDSVITVEKL